jgi:hypothetical protein
MPIAFEEGEVERPSTGGLSDSSMRKSKGKGREKDDMQLLHRRLADKNHRAETGLGREHPDKYRTKQGHLNFWEPEESSGVSIYVPSLAFCCAAQNITDSLSITFN